MNYLRRIAVRAVEGQYQSPELMAEIFGISRSYLRDWLWWCRAEGEAALDMRTTSGAALVLTVEMDRWLHGTIPEFDAGRSWLRHQTVDTGNPGGVFAATVRGMGDQFDGGVALAPPRPERPVAVLSGSGARPRGRCAFPVV